jgi:hypothetical protein
MSTFYAGLTDVNRAQELVRHLLSDGIELDDISLVTRDTSTLEGAASPSIGDATRFIGRSDDPTHDVVDDLNPDADSDMRASRVGGGVSTSNIGEDVESVDQMDDSQSVAEDLTWPRDEPESLTEIDSIDLEQDNIEIPPPVSTLNEAFATGTEVDRSLEPVVIPGLGVVMGGGDLATAAFDWAGQNGKADPSALLTYLQDEGVPPEPANELLREFQDGGSILAVALLPETDETALEEVAERYGAVSTGWFGAPRY